MLCEKHVLSLFIEVRLILKRFSDTVETLNYTLLDEVGEPYELRYNLQDASHGFLFYIVGNFVDHFDKVSSLLALECSHCFGIRREFCYFLFFLEASPVIGRVYLV